MDIAQFRLLSGSSALDCLSTGDFATISDIQQSRLMIALCMDTAPVEADDDYNLWLQLLADAIAVSVSVKNDDGIESENMRNYSYKFRDYANSWLALGMKSGDLLQHFNSCDTGITFQSDVASHIYGHGHACGCEACYECV